LVASIATLRARPQAGKEKAQAGMGGKSVEATPKELDYLTKSME
jgi:hypothetical protein